MKKKLVMVLTGLLLLTACAPNFGEQEEIVQETEDESKETAIIPKYNISDSYYKMILPFKQGEARGLVSEQLNTRLDIDEFETGLMRIAQDTFSTDKYLYQEGQYLTSDVIKSWLKRKLTGDALKQAQAEAKENGEKFADLGLNPALTGEGGLEQQNSANPIYLAHMLEHNYLIREGDTVELGGVVIGLAMNSVHYFNQEAGYAREHNISRSEILSKGKEIAQEVINRVRNTSGLENVPIVIALYEQEKKSSIVPGNFIAKTTVKQGTNNLGKWEDINEDYYFFPSNAATKDYRDDAQMFNRFKQDIEEFFPNYTGVIGKAFYKNEELNYLDIEIPMQFYGKAEVVAFTQFVTGKIMEYFPDYMNVEVNIMSTSGQEALILKEPNQEEPTVHIYK
ncbi:CamS family sex pheromone protein [Metabacillus halosaccharovorans]|uniref:CamS family sex pheromone protein n=1 Tax=Metabacillus halosaccharovorans TaxID=930124 RepID=UPI001C1FF77E|nr:CamS family sex pheromone protein [Metabacillus halosaccharovorans]MBU7594679.1 CamS family sex pheromone protein [Metabacillus halosaccharovorans]